MDIIVTGSLGNISKPLTTALVQKGHLVTVVSSHSERQKNIEALGAAASIGSLEDAAFLTSVFRGADAVYCIIPPPRFFDQHFDIEAHFRIYFNNYVQAIEQSGVKRVVFLSTIGAHVTSGNGILGYACYGEEMLGQLPDDVAIKFMRPVGFYYNMFAFIPSIKAQNAIVQNYGGDDKEPWVSPLDIAAVIVEELEKPFEGREIRYVASDEVSPNEVAKVLGEAIGRPDLKWKAIADEELLNALITSGMNRQIAESMVEMNTARRSGLLYEDYYRNKPTLGKVKLKDFAKEFAHVYNQG